MPPSWSPPPRPPSDCWRRPWSSGAEPWVAVAGPRVDSAHGHQLSVHPDVEFLLDLYLVSVSRYVLYVDGPGFWNCLATKHLLFLDG